MYLFPGEISDLVCSRKVKRQQRLLAPKFIQKEKKIHQQSLKQMREG